MWSIDAWYLWIIVSTEKEFVIPLNFLFKVTRMRSLREVCVLLCITEHSHLLSSAFARYSCSYTGNAYCRSQQANMPCVFTSQQMFGQNFRVWAPAIRQKKIFLNTYLSAGIIGGASKQPQGYILCSSLGCETTLCSLLPRAKAKQKHPHKDQQR